MKGKYVQAVRNIHKGKKEKNMSKGRKEFNNRCGAALN